MNLESENPQSEICNPQSTIHNHIFPLHITIDDRKRLHIAFDAALFNDKWSGSVECRIKTEKPEELLEWLHGVDG